VSRTGFVHEVDDVPSTASRTFLHIGAAGVSVFLAGPAAGASSEVSTSAQYDFKGTPVRPGQAGAFESKAAVKRTTCGGTLMGRPPQA